MPRDEHPEDLSAPTPTEDPNADASPAATVSPEATEGEEVTELTDTVEDTAPTPEPAPIGADEVDRVPTPPWTASPEHGTSTAPDHVGHDNGPDADAGDSAAHADTAAPEDEAATETDGSEEPAEPGKGRRSGVGIRGRLATLAGATSRLNRPLTARSWVTGSISVTLAAALFVGGWAIGARDPLLAPVRIAPGPVASSLSQAESVYATVEESVVTIFVPSGGSGSGFFYRPDRIVTNNHVVASSTEVAAQLAMGKRPKVKLLLSDGRERSARVLAADPRLDLAILETDPGLGVRPLAFGDSRDLTPGSPAFVVGSPFGLATSVSSGIISGIDRSTQFATDSVQSSLIQTDAAVNPGNSGGPLLDATAAVVGIVTLRPDQADGRSAQGLAFALPSAIVVSAINQMERYGDVSHPQIGVVLTSPDLDKAGQRPAAVVDQVVPNSPAEEAGLKAGDQLLVVDGKVTRQPADVIDALVGKRAGENLRVRVARGNQVFGTVITLRERPDDH